jgi:hypothetical protein
MKDDIVLVMAVGKLCNLHKHTDVKCFAYGICFAPVDLIGEAIGTISKHNRCREALVLLARLLPERV